MLEPLGVLRRAAGDLLRCPVPCFKPPDKWPLQLVLSRVRQGADIGNTGMFNQFEFFSILLDISRQKVDAWTVRTLECVQQSLGKHTALHISHDHGAAKAPAASSSASKPADDWSFFDSALLQPAAKAVHVRKNPDEGDIDQLSEFDFDGAEEADLLDMFLEAMEEKGQPDPNPNKRKLADAVEAEAKDDAKAPSEAGSVRSVRSGQVKTIATEMTLVQEALQEIGRRFLHLFRNPHVHFAWPLTREALLQNVGRYW